MAYFIVALHPLYCWVCAVSRWGACFSASLGFPHFAFSKLIPHFLKHGSSKSLSLLMWRPEKGMITGGGLLCSSTFLTEASSGYPYSSSRTSMCYHMPHFQPPGSLGKLGIFHSFSYRPEGLAGFVRFHCLSLRTLT